MPVADTRENMMKCLCGKCPSFAGPPAFYCAKGKAEKEVDKKGCLCSTCSLWTENNLSGGYFCAMSKAP